MAKAKGPIESEKYLTLLDPEVVAEKNREFLYTFGNVIETDQRRSNDGFYFPRINYDHQPQRTYLALMSLKSVNGVFNIDNDDLKELPVFETVGVGGMSEKTMSVYPTPLFRVKLFGDEVIESECKNPPMDNLHYSLSEIMNSHGAVKTENRTLR